MQNVRNKSGIRGIRKIGQGWQIRYAHQRPTGDVSIRYKAFKLLEDAVKFKNENGDIVL